MNIEEACQYLNDTNRHYVSRGGVFGDSYWFWQSLSEDKKPQDPRTPLNSSIGMFHTEQEIINMADKELSLKYKIFKKKVFAILNKFNKRTNKNI